MSTLNSQLNLIQCNIFLKKKSITPTLTATVSASPHGGGWAASQQIDEGALGISVALNIALGHGKGGMACQQLNIPQASTYG